MLDPRFPELTLHQIRTLKKYGQVKDFDRDTIVFRCGETDIPFCVILRGSLSIIDLSNNGELIVEHKVREFTGDSNMLSHRASQFDGKVSANSKILFVEPAKLKKAISEHSEISDILLNAFLLRQETVLNSITGGIKIVGTASDKKCFEIRDFLDKNHIWYHFVDVESSANADDLLKHFAIKLEELPILINAGGHVCKSPTIEEVARYSGVLVDFDDSVYDVIVVGAGPAGLAASVYAASEGLTVVTIDCKAPGGQAGKSSKIENYLGFPTGISGGDLANRAYVQAQKFGCTISIPQVAKSVEYKNNLYSLNLERGQTIRSRSIITATGAAYSQLPIENINKFEGSGIYYSATTMNISHCKDEITGVVGGGNSAGQAALFLAEHAKEVHIFLRSGDLGAKMSDYLVQRITASEKIYLHTFTEVKELYGDAHLEEILLRTSDGETKRMNLTNLFTFIGAKPATSWLEDTIEMDKKGFICTGPQVSEEAVEKQALYQNRSPHSLECSSPGFFAVGDVRKGSVKRVASAVGEGSMAVSQVHQYLAQIG